MPVPYKFIIFPLAAPNDVGLLLTVAVMFPPETVTDEGCSEKACERASPIARAAPPTKVLCRTTMPSYQALVLYPVISCGKSLNMLPTTKVLYSYVVPVTYDPVLPTAFMPWCEE